VAKFKVGDKVIVTETNFALGYEMGEIGTVSKVWDKLDDSEVDFPDNRTGWIVYNWEVRLLTPLDELL